MLFLASIKNIKSYCKDLPALLLIKSMSPITQVEVGKG